MRGLLGRFAKAAPAGSHAMHSKINHAVQFRRDLNVIPASRGVWKSLSGSISVPRLESCDHPMDAEKHRVVTLGGTKYAQTIEF
tara:strand:+ start:395 stop:646 length:252 start_codon:yes stop_codon:yes gene_type:complete